MKLKWVKEPDYNTYRQVAFRLVNEHGYMVAWITQIDRHTPGSYFLVYATGMKSTQNFDSLEQAQKLLMNDKGLHTHEPTRLAK